MHKDFIRTRAYCHAIHDEHRGISIVQLLVISNRFLFSFSGFFDAFYVIFIAYGVVLIGKGYSFSSLDSFFSPVERITSANKRVRLTLTKKKKKILLSAEQKKYEKNGNSFCRPDVISSSVIFKFASKNYLNDLKGKKIA